MMKIEPSTTRGIALSALMYGANTSASMRTRPSATPNTIPSATPMRKPRNASSRVVAIWSQSGPCAVPLVIQVQSCAATPEGRP